MMKIHSGLVGISNNMNNANTCQQFFLATPEMSHLSKEFKGQLGNTVHKPQEHYEVQLSVVKKEHDDVSKIKAAILNHGNPFDAEGYQLYDTCIMFISSTRI